MRGVIDDLGFAPRRKAPLPWFWRRCFAWLVTFACGVAYAALVGGGVWLGRALAGGALNSVAVALPAAIMLALMCRYGLRDWPWMALGLATLGVGPHSLEIMPAGLLIAGQTAGCAFAATLLRRRKTMFT